jgi:hypothetical protein
MISKVGKFIKLNNCQSLTIYSYKSNDILYIPSHYVNNIRIYELLENNVITINILLDIDKKANLDLKNNKFILKKEFNYIDKNIKIDIDIENYKKQINKIIESL